VLKWIQSTNRLPVLTNNEKTKTAVNKRAIFERKKINEKKFRSVLITNN